MRVRGGAALQQMHMLSAAHINGRRSCAAEMMGMAVAGICLEGYFVDMTAVTGNGFSRNSGKSMVMGIFTAAGNFYTALYFVNMLSGRAGFFRFFNHNKSFLLCRARGRDLVWNPGTAAADRIHFRIPQLCVTSLYYVRSFERSLFSRE